MKNTNLLIQEIWQNPNSIGIKRMAPGLIAGKLLKTKGKEKIFKVIGE